MTAIVDYKAGNLTSVKNAFAAIGAEAVVTRDASVVERADRVVFPGVGAAASAMSNLRAMGLADAVRKAAATKPFLGICLGMQILFESSEEDGGVGLLGVIPGKVRRFPSVDGCKVPQIGWNQVNGSTDYYFVHSYCADVGPHTVGVTDYAGVSFTSVVKKDALLACQFHPEKSGKAGLRLIEDWLAGKPFRDGGKSGASRLTRRVIPCLDVRRGRVTKGVKFKNNIDLGDPVEMAVAYSDGGADELVFYDITASAERRPIDIAMVESVAKAIRIPFAVGGGISCLADMERVILAGAEKISVNSLAVRNPAIIAEGAAAFGRQCIVLGMDPVKSDNPNCPSGYEITTRGFREFTGMDAVEWARRAASLGAGEIVVNSVDADGTRKGFEIALTRMISDAVDVPVVASGGAGEPSHLVDVFRDAKADAAIVAGMIHSGEYSITDIKRAMSASGVPTRMSY
ncbi:MAG: imidazole glycerol phosphate synthase subunit HisF [Kiritimatiellae bacterium]|nr:imidazole glycerol phosphate synthase subunit HisF [Kiritimatiellia bacterium]